MLILNGSPHVGGVADALAQAAAEASHSQQLKIRDFHCAPCQGCNYCASKGLCKWASPPDDAAAIFSKITQSRALIIVAPIYFYALPGIFKIFIDRCQLFWNWPEKSAPKPAAVILVAGRPRGDQLFTGALLTLKYFLEPLAFRLQDKLCFRGLNDIHNLRAQPQILAAVQALGNKLACEIY